MQTHENYIKAVADLAIARLNPTDQTRLRAIKLVYGAGDSGTRGITYFDRWKGGENEPAPFVEVCAFGQSSWLQVAGTTLHELGHVLAGWKAGHSAEWKSACETLGLRRIKAAGTEYKLAMFEPGLRRAIAALERPDDGEPVRGLGLIGLGKLGVGQPAFKPCGAGVGTRGGRSRGPGSGSRNRLYMCECGQRIRAAGVALDAVHNPCGTAFVCQS